MALIAKRVRGWIWAHPRPARVTVISVVAAALAGGAFVGLRPDDADSGRLRHRQFAGTTEETGGATDGGPAGPSGTVDGGAGASTGAGSPATGGAGKGTAAPGAPGTTGSTAGSGPGTGQTGTSGAGSGGGGATPSTGGSGGRSNPGAGTAPGTSPTAPNGKGTTPAATAAWGTVPVGPVGPRFGHTAVWTGREMVIWGGVSDPDAGDAASDGAAYDPAAGTWRKVPAAPISPRYDARAWWTGQEMLVFGGTSSDQDVLVDGAAWNPATNAWRKIPASPLGPRDGAVVAWAGDRLVIWSGNTVPPSDSTEEVPPEVKDDGAAYVPATDRWVPLSHAPIPPRSGAQWAWTGSRLVISGGAGEGDDRTDGAAFDPAANAWSAIADRPDPGSCGGDSACTGFWTGTAALFPASGVAYDPGANRWTEMAPLPGPAAPAPGEPAVWTGRALLTWGVAGDPEDSDPYADETAAKPAAALYDPVANRWQPVSAGPLANRTMFTAVWTGGTMIVWGGLEDDDTPRGDGAAYRPE
jgi:hypothetical protein